MKLGISSILFFLSIFPSYSQQIKLDGIDVRQVVVNDTLPIHTYIDLMNLESTAHHIKTKTQFENRRFLKPKMQSKIDYNLNGKIQYKVDYGWRGGDSSRVFYKYDTTDRLIEAVNYNSIFGKDDEGRFIKIKYDELGRVIKCETKSRNTSFGYNKNGSKEWVEFVRYDYRYTDRKRNQSYLADSSRARFYYRYNAIGQLSCVVNSKNDTMVNFIYNELNQLVEKNSFNIWSNRYRYKDGRIVEEDDLEHNDLNQPILNSTSKYFYENDDLIKTEYISFNDLEEDTNYEYLFNEKGLLSEFLVKNKKGKILKHKIYSYEYY